MQHVQCCDCRRKAHSAGSYSKEKAAELRKKRWFCPVCKSELDIKLGREKLPHFAHKKQAVSGESEPESEYHLEGKGSFSLAKDTRVQCQPGTVSDFRWTVLT